MLLSRDAITAAVEARVDAADFYKPAHGHIFDAIWSLYEQGEPVDPVTVAEELRRANLLEPLGGKGNLLRLQATTPASANAAHYAQDRRRPRAAAAAHRGRGRDRGDARTASPTTSPRRSTGPSAGLRGRRAAHLRLDGPAVRLGHRRPLDQLEHMYGEDGSAHRRAHRLPRPRQDPARAPALDAEHRRRPPRRREDRVHARGRGERRDGEPAGRCCSSRWRWARSSSPSACSRPRHASTPRKLQTGKLNDADWPRLNTRRSAASPRRRCSSTTTRTAP